ncbi:hypothetical protein EV356DRAFT_537254 [Viridothelium virens]|uniref:Uncharacterized protein n=1 Tax=Viridothelium virens TaxID=1048519 RepID=A0A6A6GV83_VIRVR|nr:hypothetical protein EV356DRAFT_537254 [Viridothelium virens]
MATPQIQQHMTIAGINVYRLTAIIFALGVVRQLGPQSLRSVPFWLPARAANLLLNSLIGFGTPFFAWNIVANEHPVIFGSRLVNRIVIDRLVVGIAAVCIFATVLQPGTLKTALLWATIGSCWVLGIVVTPSEVSKMGLRWLGRGLAMEMI